MPVIRVKSLDDLPEGIKELAKAEGDGFTVDVVPKAKLDEFRDNNINLSKKLTTAEERLTAYSQLGDNPNALASEISTLRDVERQVKDGKLKTTDEIARAVEARMAEKTNAFQAQIAETAAKLKAATDQRDEYISKYNRGVRTSEVTKAVMAAGSGVNPAALPDIIARAEQVFEIGQDGSIVAKKNGVVWYGPDGVASITPSQWLNKVLEEAPYLGAKSQGGGATGTSAQEKALGMSLEAFNKLPAIQRLALAHKVGIE